MIWGPTRATPGVGATGARTWPREGPRPLRPAPGRAFAVSKQRAVARSYRVPASPRHVEGLDHRRHDAQTPASGPRRGSQRRSLRPRQDPVCATLTAKERLEPDHGNLRGLKRCHKRGNPAQGILLSRPITCRGSKTGAESAFLRRRIPKVSRVGAKPRQGRPHVARGEASSRRRQPPPP